MVVITVAATVVITVVITTTDQLSVFRIARIHDTMVTTAADMDTDRIMVMDMDAATFVTAIMVTEVAGQSASDSKNYRGPRDSRKIAT